MTLLRTLLTLTILLGVGAARAEDKPSAKPDAQSVDQACGDEAKTAGCGSDQVGTGLLKCLHAYKKAHAEWKPSPACHDAMKKVHGDHAKKHGDAPPAATP